MENIHDGILVKLHGALTTTYTPIPKSYIKCYTHTLERYGRFVRSIRVYIGHWMWRKTIFHSFQRQNVVCSGKIVSFSKTIQVWLKYFHFTHVVNAERPRTRSRLGSFDQIYSLNNNVSYEKKLITNGFQYWNKLIGRIHSYRLVIHYF